MKENKAAQIFLQKKFPHLSEKYTANLEKADKTVLHTLIQAVIRERVFPTEWSYERKHVVLTLEKGTLHVPVAHEYILGHIDMGGELVFTGKKGESERIETTTSCLELFFWEEDKPSFYHEVLNSVTNYALALTIAEDRKHQLSTEAEDLFQYAQSLASPLTFFEQWVIQGHTIHPCARTRMGLSTEEMAAYAPEWEGEPDVIPLAVHKSAFKMTSLDEDTVNSILFDEYPGLQTAFNKTCQKHGLRSEDYEIIPVHPWQFKHTVKVYYKAALEKKTILPIEDFKLSTAALISFRTLAPIGSRTKHHIKTAVNMQMTSAVRTVSAASTKNGPTLSRLFKTILQKDQELSHSLGMMSDVVGIHYAPRETENRHFLQKNLASILRENPEQNLAEGELAIPAASLIAASPVTGKRIVEEVVEKYGSASSFIRDYAQAVLPGLLTLITKYGISMEAHLQNCVVIFEDYTPKKAVLRDVGGIRIMNERLDRFFDEQPIDPSTNLLTDQKEELLDVFSHALFHNHFGEIIVTLARVSIVSESDLWAEVETVIEETYQQLEKDPEVCDEAVSDRKELLARPATMKALVKMRLTDQFTDNLYVDIPNPFQSRKEVPDE